MKRPFPVGLGRAPDQRLLIIKLSSLGDVVQALPVATALRRRWPVLRMTWAIEERFAALVRSHPAIDRIVSFPTFAWSAARGEAGRGWLRTLRRSMRAVREEPYDVVLDLQGLFKSSLIAVGSRATRRLGLAPQREGSALVSRPISLPEGRRHAVDQYLECAAYLGAAAEPADFGLRPEPDAVTSLARRLAQRGIAAGEPLITINPSPARRRKTWPAERWVAVADALAEQGTVVLVGGAEHARRHQRIADAARRRPLDLTGETTLAELVALLERGALHLACDSGTLHVAAALGRAVVGVYGPTAVWRLGPYGQLHAAVSHAGLCTVGCPGLCPVRRRCLRAVSADEVIARARAVLATEAGS